MARDNSYNPKEIEKKWQQRWDESGIYRTDMSDTARKFYMLTMYPYPSGNLHIGHWYAMAPSDAIARFHRMQGKNVFFPMGFDAFGLPAENAAIKHNIHPAKWTYQNIAHMTEQLRRMGPSFDWDHMVITCDPEYYKWNQWFFLKFYEMGLAYKQFAPVDWCPTCNTTLAREQVVGEERRCERCDTPVIRKELDQWFFRITNYADRLLEGLERIDWPERIKMMQTNWIGRSTGANIRFPVEGTSESLEVFTTRPDTIYGATFMVVAPEHPIVDQITTPEQRAAVDEYRYQASRQSEIERLSTEKEKTGVFTGGYAINPMTNERIPIWIADYVLMSYGTGAIMGVPAGDQRDWEFAQKYGLPIVPVVVPAGGFDGEQTKAYADPGIMVNSGPFNGMVTLGKYRREEWNEALAAQYGVSLEEGQPEAVEEIIRALEERGVGEAAVNYRLRDWLISRQRYWGTPIPIIYCDACGTVPVPYEDLPVTLPEDVDFLPTGQSPLKYHEAFLNTTCPRCGGPATRETDTMDTFVDSSWYWFRYLSPHNDQEPFDPSCKDWLPVDQYTGGAEHAVMHLLYARFWTKVMYDMGLVENDEPFERLFNQGVILGANRQRMSKSRGNVTDPDALVAEYGADVVRTYLMFIGPWEMGGPWSDEGIEGLARFMQRVWDLVVTDPQVDPDAKPTPEEIARLRRRTHQTIARATEDYQNFSFNTMLATLMKFSNDLRDFKQTSVVNSAAWDEALETLLLLLAPAAPHITEELWERMGNDYSIHQQPWPTWDPEAAREETFELVLQVNGKVRDRIQAPVGISEEEAQQLALASEVVRRFMNGKEPRKVIYVPGRLVNIVI